MTSQKTAAKETKKGANLYLFTTFQLSSLLRLETSAFWISELWRLRDVMLRTRLSKKYTYLVIFSLFRSQRILSMVKVLEKVPM